MYLKFRLAALMKERGITEGQLHDLTKEGNDKPVARNTIRAIMRNAAERVDLSTVERLARALNVRPIELFEETETPRGPARLVLQRV